VTALALTLSACGLMSGGGAMVQSGGDTPAASLAATPYYAEFRTRPYFLITHTFITYGAQDASGHPTDRKTVGFYPSVDGAIGPFLVGLSGVVGQEDFFVNQPASATYRRNLTAEQYERLSGYIESERAKPQIFNLIFNNCNDFVAGAAHAIGLKAPILRMLPPPLFVMMLAQLNR